MFARGEQVKAPVERGAQGLLAWQGTASAAGQQAKVVFHLHQQARQAKPFNLRGHQFDRQGNAVQALADINRQGQFSVAEGKALLVGHGALDQQLHGRVTQGLGAVAGGGRAGQRFKALHIFTFGAQGFAAGGEDVQVRCMAQQGFTDQGDVVEQVLAVVDHQQHLACLQAAGEAGQGGILARCQAEQGGQVGQDHGRGTERRQVQQVNTVAVMPDQQFRDAQGDGGLADATGAGQGDKALLRQLLYQGVDQRLAADHARAPQGQVMAGALGRTVGGQRHGFDAQWRNKTVAALGDRDDIALPGLAVAQCLAQRSHVHPQVAVFHHAFGPDPCDQLLFAHHIAGVLQQDQQNVHRPPPQAQRAAGLQHQALARVDAVGAEMHGLVAQVIHGCPGSGGRERPAYSRYVQTTRQRSHQVCCASGDFARSSG